MLRIAIKRVGGGESPHAPAAIAIGRQWVRQMFNAARMGIEPMRQRQDTIKLGDTDAYIKARLLRNISGEYIGEIEVDLAGGCTENAGMLLKKDGSAWRAYYSDGVVADLGATGRAKKNTVPTDLSNGVKRGAMFSGLMRQVVQCYHSKGQDAPFSWTHSRTHGLFSLLDQAPLNAGAGDEAVTQAEANRYWVIEVSSAGVLAAPVTWSGKCCDGFSVKKYLPTAAEIAAAPGLAANKETLNLVWAKSVGRSGVVQVMTGAAVAAAYVGGPWSDEIGWAFSRSGHEAQNVTARTVGLHYRTERFKLAFTYSSGALSGAMSLEDDGDISFSTSDPFWIPDALGQWSAVPRFLPTDLVGAQEGPVHVYYKGNTPFVTSYYNSGSYTWGSQTYGPANVVLSGYSPIIQALAQTVSVMICESPWQYGYEPSSPSSDTVADAFTGSESGYTNSSGAAIKKTANSSGRRLTNRASYFNGSTQSDFIDFFEIPFVPCCANSVHTRMDRYWKEIGVVWNERTSTTYAHYTACVVPYHEREGLLTMWKLRDVGSQIARTFNFSGILADYWVRTLSGGPYTPAPCWTDASAAGTHPGVVNLDLGQNSPIETSTVTTSYDDTTSGYILDLGLQAFTGTLPLAGGDVRSDVNRAFTITSPPSTLNFGFDAMHGGMQYAPLDPSAEAQPNHPPLRDERNNYIYKMPDTYSTAASFQSDQIAPTAFVGQA